VDNPYKASKLAAEHYVNAYRECYGLNTMILRFSNVYGPRMRWDDAAAMASLRRCREEKGHIEITGDGTQRRSWTHVSDIVEGLVKAAKSKSHMTIDLCSQDIVTMNEVAQYFNCPVVYVPDRTGDSWELPQKAINAQQVLGWSAKVRLEDGIWDVIPKPVGAKV